MSDPTTDPRRAERNSKALVIALVGIFLFGMLGFVLAVIDADEEDAGPPAAPSLPAAGIEARAPGADARAPRVLLAVADRVEADPEPSPSPDASAAPAVAAAPAEAELDPSAGALADTTDPTQPMVDVRTPVVPVTGFWSSQTGVRRSDLRDALTSGQAPVKGARRILVEASIAEAVAAELDIELHPDVRVADVDALARAVRKGALALVAAADVRPSMRSLALNGVSLVGVDRIEDAADWPLSVGQRVPAGAAWDQARTWSLVAGGDSFTDRGVYDTVVRRGKGVDYPFDGGTARITGYGCCDPVFNDNVVPRYRLTGDRGLVRRLFKGADLAIANHEQPVTEQAAFHSSGTRFSGKPALTRIFTRAGIDYLSLANNHIKDYGADGIKDTRRILRRAGIAFGGAGRDLEQARKVAYLKIGDTELAIVPCLDIVKAYWADGRTSGATPCLDRYIVPDIKAAKRRGAVVVVFPHWGVEYTRQPLGSMRKHAARWAKAGADMVLGAHSHVAGAVEDVGGTPVLYSLGNLIFDQDWSTNTMISALLEATFHGDQLIELRLRPYLIHDTSQPNLMDPTQGEGRRLLKQIRAASSAWLDW